MEGDAFDLENVPVRVANVNFDGLERTKGDFVARAVKEVFQAKTFGQLIFRVGEAQDRLRKLETFRDVGTIIDVDKNEVADSAKSEEGYNVTFVVKEYSRIAASAKTQMGGQTDAQVTTGIRMPNLFGRGEKLEVEYSYSSSKEKNMEISLMKPILAIPKLPNASIKGSFFQTKSSNQPTSYRNTAVGSLITLHSHSMDSQLRNFHHRVEYEGTWRQITPFDHTTPIRVMWDCGHSFKSAIRHVFTVDGRDRPIFPNSGYYANVLQEFAGIFGDVKYHKFDIDFQHNIALLSSMVFQTSFRMGLITPVGEDNKTCGIVDRFYCGGPYSLRGFTQRGVEGSSEAAGDLAHWAAGLHLYSRLPYVNRRYPVVESCRLHFFLNAGNLADKLLGASIFRNMRLSYGMGLAVALGNFGRLEVNYCWPVKYSYLDSCVKGFQLGVGVHFL